MPTAIQEAVEQLLEAPKRGKKKRKGPGRGNQGGHLVDYWRTMPNGHRVGFRKPKGKGKKLFKGRGMAVTGHPKIRAAANKKAGKKESQQSLTPDQIMETTVTGMIPMIPAPLEGLGEFSPSVRNSIVGRLQSLFPRCSKAAIEVAVFGKSQQPIAG